VAALDFGPVPFDLEADGAVAATPEPLEEAVTTVVETASAKLEDAAYVHDFEDPRMEMRAVLDGAAAHGAVGNLSPADQARYAAVLGATARSGVPDAYEAAVELARTGFFEDHPKLLAALDTLLTQDHATKLEAAFPGQDIGARLVGEALVQLAKPERIRQAAGFNTCGEATLERLTAMRDPVGYVRFIADISDRTRPALLNGVRVHLSTRGLASADASDRTLVSTLFQQGFHAAYGDWAGEGLPGRRFENMVERQDPHSELFTFKPDQAAVALAAAQPGAILLLAAPGAPPGLLHAVQLEAYDRGSGQAILLDPLGKRISTDLTRLAPLLRGALLPKDTAIVETAAAFDVGAGTLPASTGSYLRSRGIPAPPPPPSPPPPLPPLPPPLPPAI
jgi:hypothetical protein